VRRNYIHHCGVAGLCGWQNKANQSSLVEDNLITDNGWMPITHHYETGGVKIHYTVDCLFRPNALIRNRHSAALWSDGYSTNTRITQSVFCETSASPFGSIFLAITQGPNLVDHNVIVGSSTHGIYEHDAARVLALQNLIAHGTGSALFPSLGGPERKFNGPHPQEYHRAYGNVLSGFDAYVTAPTGTSRSDYNVLGGVTGGGGKAVEVQGKGAYDLVGWRALGNGGGSVEIPLRVSFDPERLKLRVAAPAGAVLPSCEPFALTPGIPPLSELLDNNFVWPVDAKLGTQYAPLAGLLQADLLGRPRDPSRFGVGPLVGLPLDGTPACTDPGRPAETR
jgi:hypothetical protein